MTHKGCVRGMVLKWHIKWKWGRGTNEAKAFRWEQDLIAVDTLVLEVFWKIIERGRNETEEKINDHSGGMGASCTD